MTSYLNLFNFLVPIVSVVTSLVSIFVSYLAFNLRNKHVVYVNKKNTETSSAPLVEDRAELPGFDQEVDTNDVDKRT
jgi:hypothetical protein